MSVTLLLKQVTGDTVGQETPIRIVGNREPPARMVIQVAIDGTAVVQIQGKIARDAPWLDLGPAYSASALAHLDPIPFLRAIAKQMISGSSVSVWTIWGW